MKCVKCFGELAEKKDFTPEGFEYRYFKCGKCGKEIVNMEQLHEVAEKYREMKKYRVKLSMWGKSRALRIPKELTKAYGLQKVSEVSLVPDKKSIRIVAAEN